MKSPRGLAIAIGMVVTACSSAPTAASPDLASSVPSQAQATESVPSLEPASSQDWTFDTTDSSSEPDPGTEVPGEADGAFAQQDVTLPEPYPAGHPFIDPCELLTLEEWARWRDVDPSQAWTDPLEGGLACGYGTQDDAVRVAFAMLTPSWITGYAAEATTEVGGRAATWSIQFPIPESSILVVPVTDDLELVLEVSRRAEGGSATMLDGAVALATIILERYER